MKRKALSRAGRKEQVVDAFRVALTKDDDAPKSMRWVAKRLDLSPSTKLIRILDEMCEEGTLCSFWVRDRSDGKWDTKLYAFQGKVKQREIKVKRNKKQIGQIELW